MSGRYVIVEDGALSRVPHVPKKRGSYKRQAPKPRKPGGGPMAISLKVPGFREFLSFDAKHQMNRCGHKRTKTVGSYNGYTAAELTIIKKKARIKAMKDYEKLFAEVKEEDPLAEYAIKRLITMLNEPINPKDAHAMIRTLLEYRKAKPASVSKVTVEQSQDTWAELLETSDKNEPRDSLN